MKYHLKIFRYVEIKKRPFTTEIVDKLISQPISEESFLKEIDQLPQVVKDNTKLEDNMLINNIFFTPKASFMNFQFNFQALIPSLSADLNTIYSYSPSPIKIDRNNFIANVNELIGCKRIQL